MTTKIAPAEVGEGIVGDMKGQDVLLVILILVGAFIAFGPEQYALLWVVLVPFGVMLGAYVAIEHLAYVALEHLAHMRRR